MPVSLEQVKLGKCGEPLCDRLETITIKRISPDGWLFECYCKPHFGLAVEFLQKLWKEKPSDLTPVKDDLQCCQKECKNGSVLVIRLRMDRQVKQFPFCLPHLNIAFEVAAEVGDAIERGEA
jgi:hypothetical protein